jgi:hypothetical protein
MKQSRKDFIKQAHESACSDWKEKIEKEFPKLFKKDDLVVGKWYKHYSGGFNYLVCSIDNITAYGFMDRKYFKSLLFGSQRLLEGCVPATDKEVEQSLIKEAKKRGFKEGVKFRSVIGSAFTHREGYFLKNGILYENNLNIGGNTIFKDGVWATIIKETITKEQAEKELGKTILN